MQNNTIQDSHIDMKKTILFLFYGECHTLPPFLAIIDCLKHDYILKVISYETRENQEKLQKLYPEVKFLEITPNKGKESFCDKVVRKLYRPLPFYKDAVRALNNTNYDLLWVIHESSLVLFTDVLKDKKYIASIYEVNDHNMKFAKRMQKGVTNARAVITCEYNRSCIMRVWYKLNYTPKFIPNKPYFHPKEKNLPCKFSSELEGKKIMLFQGHINTVRRIDTLCDAVSMLDDYTLVLMGGGDPEYIKFLKDKYKNIIFTGFITPPDHLLVTSHARIGIVKYDYIYLDHAYCAPNKIWEYTGFGIPVLGNDLPGLESTIGQAGAGLCIAMDTPESIVQAIKTIESNYEQYSANAKKFYESYDLDKALRDIVTTYID